jgi:hypothetical protein
MLIINESSICDFLHSTLLQFYPYYYSLHIILFFTLAEYQPYVYSILLKFCSETEEELEYFDEEF